MLLVVELFNVFYTTSKLVVIYYNILRNNIAFLTHLNFMQRLFMTSLKSHYAPTNPTFGPLVPSLNLHRGYQLRRGTFRKHWVHWSLSGLIFILRRHTPHIHNVPTVCKQACAEDPEF